MLRNGLQEQEKTIRLFWLQPLLEELLFAISLDLLSNKVFSGLSNHQKISLLIALMDFYEICLESNQLVFVS